MPLPVRPVRDPDLLLAEIDRLQGRLDAVSRQADAASRDTSVALLARWMAHEVANRMAPIAGYASAALREADPELTHKALWHAREGCERLSELAQLLLSLGDADSAVEAVGADVGSAWQAVSGLLAREAADRRVEIHGGIASGCRVTMAPSALEHVLLNLLSNALKASREGDDICVQTDLCSTGNTRLIEIRVVDSGGGIPEGVLHRVFDAGFSGRGGQGLGLALVKRLVEAAGGGVAIHSSLGKGTTAIVRIPAWTQVQTKTAEQTTNKL